MPLRSDVGLLGDVIPVLPARDNVLQSRDDRKMPVARRMMPPQRRALRIQRVAALVLRGRPHCLHQESSRGPAMGMPFGHERHTGGHCQSCGPGWKRPDDGVGATRTHSQFEPVITGNAGYVRVGGAAFDQSRHGARKQGVVVRKRPVQHRD